MTCTAQGVENRLLNSYIWIAASLALQAPRNDSKFTIICHCEYSADKTIKHRFGEIEAIQKIVKA